MAGDGLTCDQTIAVRKALWNAVIYRQDTEKSRRAVPFLQTALERARRAASNYGPVDSLALESETSWYLAKLLSGCWRNQRCNPAQCIAPPELVRSQTWDKIPEATYERLKAEYMTYSDLILADPNAR